MYVNAKLRKKKLMKKNDKRAICQIKCTKRINKSAISIKNYNFIKHLLSSLRSYFNKCSHKEGFNFIKLKNDNHHSGPK